MNHVPDLVKVRPAVKSGRMKKHYKTFMRSRFILMLFLPGLVYFLLFHYGPMYGVIIAFKDYNVFDGVMGSPWTKHHGFGHFMELSHSEQFYTVLKNTLLLNFYQLLFAFPAPIILALSLNEVKNMLWKRFVQTISYLPHFISIVVLTGMIHNILSLNGTVNHFMQAFGFEKVQFLLEPGYFRTIFVSSDIWQGIGWGSIIYLAALAGIDPQLYDAAKMDGARRWHQIIHINIPGIMPTIVILLIFNIGGFMGGGFDKVMLLYNPNTYETADVIGTYVYRRGILGAEFSFSTAVGLFQSAIGLILITGANFFARKLNETSLW